MKTNPTAALKAIRVVREEALRKWVKSWACIKELLRRWWGQNFSMECDLVFGKVYSIEKALLKTIETFVRDLHYTTDFTHVSKYAGITKGLQAFLWHVTGALKVHLFRVCIEGNPVFSLCDDEDKLHHNTFWEAMIHKCVSEASTYKHNRC